MNNPSFINCHSLLAAGDPNVKLSPLDFSNQRIKRVFVRKGEKSKFD